ncbi:uncharacterized protein L3040_002654 [Drepanopeziza brunnea f. sp. 'multigermtubi']|uniref:2EXR domain-containing protein n=1 Tax=Marssonina brunnea f. sp. multigermtubi (strain MB_m1) TaxID=1072389 RepID=K1Y2S6_MARBU|nr:uncharacterized protein MBM_02706 [Drepanopeziza brunnea f. sp. 'multigermtubi' MB_m1]EKD19469.1 hypothetical protein MBM_02706 [Drepanopeziza brunnea f. sp. 'multigermtubi' MB_m1]KAJ5050783.1 hypothetical protein L3040_002654 [Drepanopeziza brunnea f. sp. 'multigermtubi']
MALFVPDSFLPMTPDQITEAQLPLTYKPLPVFAARRLQTFLSTGTDPNASFTIFSRLPLELRRKIWRLSLPERNIITIYTEIWAEDRGYTRRVYSAISSRLPPATLFANRESRAVTLEHYSPLFTQCEGQGGDRITYMDFQIDVLRLGILGLCWAKSVPGVEFDLRRVKHLAVPGSGEQISYRGHENAAVAFENFRNLHTLFFSTCHQRGAAHLYRPASQWPRTLASPFNCGDKEDEIEDGVDGMRPIERLRIWTVWQRLENGGLEGFTKPEIVVRLHKEDIATFDRRQYLEDYHEEMERQTEQLEREQHATEAESMIEALICLAFS